MKKQVTPVMLATKEDNSNIYFENGNFKLLNGLDITLPIHRTNHQHLYLTTTDDDIKHDDWIINGAGIMKVDTEYGNHWDKSIWSKIIATTNRSLKLPIIHPDFVKYFVEKQCNVGVCEVEYETIVAHDNFSIKGTLQKLKLTNGITGYVAVSTVEDWSNILSNKHKEGFTEVTIPEQKFKSCSGCKFYSHSLVRSGNNPIYANNCNHTDFRGENFGMPHKLNRTQNGYVVTPEWCPFLKSK